MATSVEMANRIEMWPRDRLKRYARNARTHNKAQISKIAASIMEFGFNAPILVDEQSETIIAGHGRLDALELLDIDPVPVIPLGHLSDAQRRAYILADNRLALDAGWDDDMLAEELAALQDDGFDLALTGFNDDELAALLDDEAVGVGDGDGDGENHDGNLSDRFLIPPFSVFNAREGWWQDRKRWWLATGIKSEVGRDAKAFGTEGNSSEQTGTSIFDPVLCEIAYRWFCPDDGVILDPFAGGSVRGIVAAKLGRQYIGCDLRGEQVDANREQADAIIIGNEPMPIWNATDSRYIDRVCQGVDADFVFTCPPYVDLEVYSDNPADLSTLAYQDFRAAYFEIIAKACSLLKPNRFACCVVGEVRGKDGNYYDFVGDTVEAFRAAGLAYYNEAILLTAIGSLPIRAGKQFSATRKLGKTHQNVLVFVKGDPKKATKACGDVDVTLPDGMEQGEPDAG